MLPVLKTIRLTYPDNIIHIADLIFSESSSYTDDIRTIFEYLNFEDYCAGSFLLEIYQNNRLQKLYSISYNFQTKFIEIHYVVHDYERGVKKNNLVSINMEDKLTNDFLDAQKYFGYCDDLEIPECASAIHRIED